MNINKRVACVRISATIVLTWAPTIMGKTNELWLTIAY